ncbi:stage II sporulation protein R [Alkalibacillus aidingensis]|uniref:stage II sporulation protein R n=1 Tax=Alkalibacillus aidingensis TaxID=2747607 RepID=UPI0016606EEA|nr:stage II sporulation protein R [Alkalibacillus aidingensis]
MRYLIAVLVILVTLQFLFTESVAENKGQVTADTNESGYQVIPDEAIRLRILANSNSEEDQELKEEVRNEVNEQITEWVEELTSIETARDTIKENLPEIEKTVANLTGDDDFTVEFGDVEFPDKVYDRFVYPGGTYEAILITLGEGEGDNWWCVLFPPLCFVEFSSGATVLEHEDEDEQEQDLPQVNDKKEDSEVSFFLWEWLKKLFNFS